MTPLPTKGEGGKIIIIVIIILEKLMSKVPHFNFLRFSLIYSVSALKKLYLCLSNKNGSKHQFISLYLLPPHSSLFLHRLLRFPNPNSHVSSFLTFLLTLGFRILYILRRHRIGAWLNIASPPFGRSLSQPNAGGALPPPPSKRRSPSQEAEFTRCFLSKCEPGQWDRFQ